MDEQRLSPGQEGSPEALQLLHFLRVTSDAGGSSITDILALTGMSKPAAQAALTGLLKRGRVRSAGHGMGSRWSVVK